VKLFPKLDKQTNKEAIWFHLNEFVNGGKQQQQQRSRMISVQIQNRIKTYDKKNLLIKKRFSIT